MRYGVSDAPMPASPLPAATAPATAQPALSGEQATVLLTDIAQTMHAMNENISRLYQITRDHYPQGQ